MKPNTYTQIYIQLVFAVKFRDAALDRHSRSRIFEYMSGILTSMNHKSIIINGISNHVHIFLGANPKISISDTVHDLKRSSSLYINQNALCKGHFAWQDGYGAFSYGRSQIQDVYDYIMNQEMHHKKKTFQEEYLDFLRKFEIEYDLRYLFDFYD
jgi:REP element-mobilizing transposase RayT